jgi:hypothetical protein
MFGKQVNKFNFGALVNVWWHNWGMLFGLVPGGKDLSCPVAPQI